MWLSGQLPFHATLAGFLIFWVPWIAVDLGPRLDAALPRPSEVCGTGPTRCC